MTQSALIQWEVRQTGSDSNGGGFKSGAAGTDRTLQDAAQVAIDNSTITTSITTNVITFSAGYTPSSADVGNCVQMLTGTNVTVGIYEITSQTSTTWTVDRNVVTSGTTTDATGNMGGALATPGKAPKVALVARQKIWVKYSATPYAITTSTVGAAGPISIPTGIGLVMTGYDVTRGDRTGNRPVYQWQAASPGVNTFIATLVGSDRQHLANMIFDGNTVVNVSGVNQSTLTSTFDCIVKNCTQSGTVGYFVSGAISERCQADTCLTGFQGSANNSGWIVMQADAVNCTTGFLMGSGGGPAVNCIARSCGTGFSTNSTLGSFLKRCTADSCTGNGFTSTTYTTYIDCLASNQTAGGGIGFNVGTGLTVMINCAVYNNTSNVTGTPTSTEGLITLTADPYINRALADFRPNRASGGGASLRNAGIGVYGQTNNVDIGAIQHSDVSGGGISIGF